MATVSRTRTIVNRVGGFTLFRWLDGTTHLTLRVDGPSSIMGPPAPKLDGWACFFVGRHVTYSTFTYRRVAA